MRHAYWYCFCQLGRRQNNKRVFFFYWKYYVTKSNVHNYNDKKTVALKTKNLSVKYEKKSVIMQNI